MLDAEERGAAEALHADAGKRQHGGAKRVRDDGCVSHHMVVGPKAQLALKGGGSYRRASGYRRRSAACRRHGAHSSRAAAQAGPRAQR